MGKTFRAYNLDQRLLLPPDMRQWLPEGHLALFLLDVVSQLDLTEILQVYEDGDGRGQPPYHPVMMVTLLLYAYCTGKPSSRRIERATFDEVPYRVVAGDQHPDHDSIAAFRQRHLPALARLFVQVLQLCEAAGLVKLGHVALDGTKIKANASKHKAMSYERMCAQEQELEAEVARLLEQAQQVDAAEDAEYGKGRRGDELPAELARRETRLRKIREAKTALEAEARARAEQAAAQAREKLAERARREAETGKKMGGRPPQVPDPEQAQPEPTAQRNFTDPESRIMKDGATKGFEQAYNAQAAVDSTAQIIVATAVTQEANDKQQLQPMLEKVQENCGRLPEKASADAGYFNTEHLTAETLSRVELYVPPDRQKHGAAPDTTAPTTAADASVVDQMRQKLKTAAGQAVYKWRKAIVEPVFGQTKEARGFRRFSFRGFTKVGAEWDLICLTHNLLKLWRARACPLAA
ncbi:MAG: IS1182 family transposase [Acidobacteria bacterium]|nr:IS1182 family transposase [Acidobacteriota bacterium]